MKLALAMALTSPGLGVPDSEMSPPSRCLALHLLFPIRCPVLAVLPYAYRKWLSVGANEERTWKGREEPTEQAVSKPSGITTISCVSLALVIWS